MKVRQALVILFLSVVIGIAGGLAMEYGGLAPW